MPETLTVRCSSLPRLVACAAATVEPAVRVEPPRGPSDLGTAFHECMAAIVRDLEPDDHIAERHNVDADELAALFGWTRKLWYNRLGPLFPSGVAEFTSKYTEGGLTLTGTADLVALVGNEIRILDWKTGWAETDATEQLKGYAWLMLQEYQSLGEVRVTRLGVRRQTADTAVYTRDKLAAWWGWLKGHLAERDTYRPGPHCGSCPRALECPGHLQQIKALALVATDPCIVAESAAAELGVGVLFARQVARRCEQFLEAAKARVEAEGGRYGPLALAEQTRRSIDVARGWDVLADAIDAETLRYLLKLSKGDAEAAVKATAPRGQKGAAVQELMSRLDAAGAIVTSTFTTLEVSRDGESNRALPADGGGTDPGPTEIPAP